MVLLEINANAMDIVREKDVLALPAYVKTVGLDITKLLVTNHVRKIVKIINVKDNLESAIRVKMDIMDLSVCAQVIAKTTNAMSAAYALSVQVVGMVNSVPSNVPSAVMVNVTE